MPNFTYEGKGMNGSIRIQECNLLITTIIMNLNIKILKAQLTMSYFCYVFQFKDETLNYLVW